MLSQVILNAIMYMLLIKLILVRPLLCYCIFISTPRMQCLCIYILTIYVYSIYQKPADGRFCGFHTRTCEKGDFFRGKKLPRKLADKQAVK